MSGTDLVTERTKETVLPPLRVASVWDAIVDVARDDSANAPAGKFETKTGERCLVSEAAHRMDMEWCRYPLGLVGFWGCVFAYDSYRNGWITRQEYVAKVERIAAKRGWKP